MRILGKGWNIFRYLGDLCHLLSIIALLFQMVHKKSCHGISLKTHILYLIVFLCRYVNSGFFDPPLYNIVFKIFYILSSIFTIILMKTVLRKSYDRRHDTFNMFIILIVCIPFGYFTSMFKDFDEVLWTYSLWLEAFAIVPQLFMIRRTQRIDVITNHYIFFLGVYRFFYICNWIRKAVVKHKTQYVVWTTGIIQTILYADFIYYYIVAFVKGSKYKLPLWVQLVHVV